MIIFLINVKLQFSIKVIGTNNLRVKKEEKEKGVFADKDVQRGKKDKKKSAMRVRRVLFEGCEDFVCNNNGRRE